MSMCFAAQRLAPTPLEKAESIDMLRALEHGYKVHLIETDVETHAVDTIEDLQLVERLMSGAALRMNEDLNVHAAQSALADE